MERVEISFEKFVADSHSAIEHMESGNLVAITKDGTAVFYLVPAEKYPFETAERTAIENPNTLLGLLKGHTEVHLTLDEMRQTRVDGWSRE